MHVPTDFSNKPVDLTAGGPAWLYFVAVYSATLLGKVVFFCCFSWRVSCYLGTPHAAV